MRKFFLFPASVILGFVSILTWGAIIWLVVIGEWKLALLGILTLVGASYLLGFILLLSTPLDMLHFKFEKNGNKIASFITGFLSLCYTRSVITIWCISVLLSLISKSNASTYTPLVLMSYGVALGPWQLMADQDQNTSSIITIAFAEIAYTLTIFFLFFFKVSILHLFIVFSSVMFIDIIVMYFLKIMEKKEHLVSESN